MASTCAAVLSLSSTPTLFTHSPSVNRCSSSPASSSSSSPSLFPSSRVSLTIRCSRFLSRPLVLFPPLKHIDFHGNGFQRGLRQVVRMAPEEEKLTRRNPLDFPIEWERPKPGRRPDIFPQFSPMKTPLPPPLPCDPPEEDEEEEEKKEEEEEDPEKEEEPEEPKKEFRCVGLM